MESQAQDPQKNKRPHIFDDIDKEILRLKLEKPTITLSDLSQRIGMSVNSIFKRTKDETFLKVMEDYQRTALQIVADAKERAARKLVKLLDSTDDRVAFQAAIALCADILPGSKVSVNHTGSISVNSMVPRPELSSSEVSEEGLIPGEEMIDIRKLAEGSAHIQDPKQLLPPANGNGVH